MTVIQERSHLLRIGDLSRLSGKSVRAIHLYEELGLVQPATRSSGGFRLYEASAVERLRWIGLLHELGFSLQDMRALVRTWWGADLGTRAMDDLRDVFERKLGETREAIGRHRKLEQELMEGLAYLETCRECATPSAVTACCGCEQDHGMPEKPALVAGFTSAPGTARRNARPGFVRVEEIE